jgi:hypothetical protein
LLRRIDDLEKQVYASASRLIKIYNMLRINSMKLKLFLSSPAFNLRKESYT